MRSIVPFATSDGNAMEKANRNLSSNLELLVIYIMGRNNNELLGLNLRYRYSSKICRIERIL